MAAVIILLIAFGSVVAVGLPIAVALFGLGLSVLLIRVLAALVDVPAFATALVPVRLRSALARTQVLDSLWRSSDQRVTRARQRSQPRPDVDGFTARGDVGDGRL